VNPSLSYPVTQVSNRATLLRSLYRVLIKTLVQLGHLSCFYKRALEKNNKKNTLLGCILRQNNGSDIFYDMSVQVAFI